MGWGGYPPELVDQGPWLQERVGGDKKKKNGVFWRMPCGVGGGVPTGAGLVALVAGEGWGGRRDDGSSKERGGLGLGWQTNAQKKKKKNGFF